MKKGETNTGKRFETVCMVIEKSAGELGVRLNPEKMVIL